MRNPGYQEISEKEIKLEYQDLTGQIIAAAIEGHRTLSPGFLASIYENALVIALHQAGLKVE